MGLSERTNSELVFSALRAMFPEGSRELHSEFKKSDLALLQQFARRTLQVGLTLDYEAKTLYREKLQEDLPDPPGYYQEHSYHDLVPEVIEKFGPINIDREVHHGIRACFSSGAYPAALGNSQGCIVTGFSGLRDFIVANWRKLSDSTKQTVRTQCASVQEASLEDGGTMLTELSVFI